MCSIFEMQDCFILPLLHVESQLPDIGCPDVVGEMQDQIRRRETFICVSPAQSQPDFAVGV